MVAANLSSVAKSVMKEQRKADKAESTLVVYGFPEDDNDSDELTHMFDFLGCVCNINSHTRFGRVGTAPRPIKVQLKSSDEVSLVLSHAKYLRDDLFYKGVNISKWLTQEELSHIKSLRQLCQKLNAENSTKSKRDKYVVISGGLKERDDSGRLKSVDSSLLTAAPASKAPTASSFSTSAPTTTTTTSMAVPPVPRAPLVTPTSLTPTRVSMTSSLASSQTPPATRTSTSLTAPITSLSSSATRPVSSHRSTTTTAAFSKNAPAGSHVAPKSKKH